MRRLGENALLISLRTRKLLLMICVGRKQLTCDRSGSNWRPQPFKVKFTPRGEEVKQTIVREGEQALKDLAEYERETKYTFSTFRK